ncbi:MAG: ankyrin repeat domain-containing protein [Gemmatimonadota bacterium]|nr:ankyrin repeat domain-containing protein [Gemmatimonadota bacterium]
MSVPPHPPPRPARALPAVPNLEQQKKQARELLEAARAHDLTALRRFRDHHPRIAALPDAEWPRARLALHDAQLVIAREYGFPSWPKLKAHIDTAVAAQHTRPFVRELEYYDERAQGLLAVLPDGAPTTVAQVRSWHPALGDASDETIRSAAASGTFTLDDARLVYARQHGFETWDRFSEQLRRLDSGDASEPLMDVLEAGRNEDWSRVAEILRAHPDLTRTRGTNGNTLLNLACSLVACPVPETPGAESGSEEDRLLPVRMLIAAGADPNQANERGWTPLHQAAYRNDPEMVALLLAAGARTDLEAHGTGGTPLAVSLFWGHREAAELLAGVEIVPRNLRIAAGLGRTDLVERCFAADGRLTTEARAGRGFYRPHSGFPFWRPSGDPQESMDEAVVWAAKAGRSEVMPILIERGARVDADPYRGTPLIWAASNGRVEAATWLLDHGADVNRRATFGGLSHGQGVTALRVAAQQNDLETVRLLVERGADLTIQDELYHGTPASWAAHFEATDVAVYLDGLIDRSTPQS